MSKYTSKVSYYRLDKSHETDDESKQNKEVGEAPSAILCVPGTIVKVIQFYQNIESALSSYHL